MWPFSKPNLHVVVVCTANVCRSPAAEALLKHHLRLAGIHRKVAVISAGTSVGTPGMPSDPRVVSILEERGVKARGIRSAPVNGSMLEKAEFIWCMDWSHLEAMEADFSDLPCRPELLADDGSEIPDPYFGDKAGVREAIDRIDTLVVRRTEQLVVTLGQLSH